MKNDEFRILGRRPGNEESLRFEYNGVTFDQDCFHVVAGLNAVDTREFTEQTFRALKEHGQVCARMGAYKPRTSPYSFQGYGKQCLPYVFELAGKYGIRVISMEVTRDEHLDEIREALKQTGNPTGVMLQIGTRNTQNFELLKSVGSQNEFPILLKRGFGITLHESLLAAEYVASAGNRNIVFCLRGMKTNFGDPHRNLIDFGHVPVVKRLTRMPVCVDPSHSVGTRDVAPDGLTDVFHVAAQGVIAGANLVLTDVHPQPKNALVDAAQALTLEELPHFLDDCALVREAYVARCTRARGREVSSG
ncbi:Phospho-2-dehydro-3-deoxyheptonate aldolase [Usitatibacter rugosus]|uniref:Phospho-2-dehydro-3-deoxyheptonate aldolase n=1 Tax=Usitatibacter rugosus TaxID=2732067 RepID=A0A6M4GWW6_9PROT|nr:3-deoxy-7-phosphoheptulonate synthase [Usitatibacter rugosus]QJR11759.1 Phospho-2-dehydro-3-deoxyheptonate aldolase [Usitatibacter rugosus]